MTDASTETEFVVERRFDVPRERVWATWTEAGRLRQWFTPRGFTMAACTLDLRPGGVFHYCQRTPQGQEIWGRWEFREIAAPERLTVVQSFADERGAIARNPFTADWPLKLWSTMTFTAAAAGTLATIRWAPIDPTDAERAAFAAGHASMQAGWAGTLDQLDAYLART